MRLGFYWGKIATYSKEDSVDTLKAGRIANIAPEGSVLFFTLCIITKDMPQNCILIIRTAVLCRCELRFYGGNRFKRHWADPFWKVHMVVGLGSS